MDTYELNKIAGAILGAGLLLMVINEIGNLLVHPVIPEAIAITVELPEPAAAGASDADDAGPSLAVLLPTGDADKGAKVAKKCAACHTFEKGGKNGQGPNLFAVLGRALGDSEGFTYSSALTEKGGTWTYEAMDGFLSAPKKWLPGTRMAFAGLRKPDDRAHMIAFLRQNHDSPPPLPTE